MKLIKNDWEVKQIPLSIAKDFVEQWHYAHGGARTAVGCYGLFYKNDPKTLHGISWWMPPPLGAAKSVSSNHRNVLALSRFCLVDDRPENAGSFLISKSIKMLNTNRWTNLLTYADTALNHNGGLYRASNWNYDGMTGKNPIYWDPVKQCMVSRKKGPKTYGKQSMLDMGYEFKGNHAKHRFVYPITRRKGIIIKPKSSEPDFIQTELAFTKEGKINKPKIMNTYICTSCGTSYSTTEDRPPPPINWDDGHKCTLVKQDKTEN